MRLFWRTAVVASLVWVGACQGGTPQAKRPEGSASPGPSAPPAVPAGIIQGRIALAEERPPVASGPLSNVFVYIKEGLDGRTFPIPKEPVTLDQVTFQFVPHVFGIRAGQTLRITSRDSSPHNVFCQPFNNKGFNESMLGGGAVEKNFTSPEVMILFQCNIHHIMKAYAGVLDHPFFAVTGADGTFVFKGLPPGHYKLAAWQEWLGNREGEVELTADGGGRLELTYP